MDSSADVKRSQSLYARLATGDSHPASSNGSRNSSSGRSGGGGGGGKDSHTSPDTTVFVANLAYTCTEAELKTFFTACGEVACIKIPRDRETGEGRGIAFVTFEKIAGTILHTYHTGFNPFFSLSHIHTLTHIHTRTHTHTSVNELSHT